MLFRCAKNFAPQPAKTLSRPTHFRFALRRGTVGVREILRAGWRGVYGFASPVSPRALPLCTLRHRAAQRTNTKGLAIARKRKDLRGDATQKSVANLPCDDAGTLATETHADGKQSTVETEAPSNGEAEVTLDGVTYSAQLMKHVVKYGGVTPLEILAAAAQGQDATPKRFHPILEFIESIVADRGESPPLASDWEKLIGMVRERCKLPDLPQQTAVNASKVLLEMEYAKPKSVEITGLSTQHPIVKPLTPEEVEIFEAHFKREY